MSGPQERQSDLNVRIHDEAGMYWAEVIEWPGCFASGFTYSELCEALAEAMEMCEP